MKNLKSMHFLHTSKYKFQMDRFQSMKTPTQMHASLMDAPPTHSAEAPAIATSKNSKLFKPLSINSVPSGQKKKNRNNTNTNSKLSVDLSPETINKLFFRQIKNITLQNRSRSFDTQFSDSWANSIC